VGVFIDGLFPYGFPLLSVFGTHPYFALRVQCPPTISRPLPIRPLQSFSVVSCTCFRVNNSLPVQRRLLPCIFCSGGPMGGATLRWAPLLRCRKPTRTCCGDFLNYTYTLLSYRRSAAFPARRFLSPLPRSSLTPSKATPPTISISWNSLSLHDNISFF